MAVDGNPIPNTPAAPAAKPAGAPKTLIAAAAGAVAALLLIIGSFLTWVVSEGAIEESGISVEASISVTGLGKGSAEIGEITVPGASAEQQAAVQNELDAARAELTSDAAKEINEDSRKTGYATIFLGLVIAAGAILLGLGKRAGARVMMVGGILATIVGLAVAIDPWTALGGDEIPDTVSNSTAAGAYLVLVGALVGLGAAIFAVVSGRRQA